VAEWPEDLVTVPVVVLIDLLIGEPDTFERVVRIVRRNQHTAILVGDVGVCVPISPRDPGSASPLEYGIEAGGQSACRPFDRESSVLVVPMAVGLSVGNDQ
jgi:hypothetical protein